MRTYNRHIESEAGGLGPRDSVLQREIFLNMTFLHLKFNEDLFI